MRGRLRSGASPAAAAVALGTTLLLVAGTFGVEPLFVTGAALLLLGAAAWAYVRLGTAGATVTRSLSSRRVVEDEPLSLRLEVRRGALPLRFGQVVEDLLPEPAPVGGGHDRIEREMRFARRGRRTLAPPRLVLGDPLGLARRTVTGGAAEAELIVLPKVLPVAPVGGPADGDGRRARALLAATSETALDGLRAHRDGTPAAHIYWPSLARGNELMDRHLVPEDDARPLVILDPRGARTPGELDAAVRAAASLTVHFAQRSGCSLLLPGERGALTVDPDMRAWPAAHVRLALVEGTVAPVLAAARQPRGLLVFVSARRRSGLPRGLGRAARTLLVTPAGAAAEGPQPLLRVAGCRVVVAGGRT